MRQKGLTAVLLLMLKLNTQGALPHGIYDKNHVACSPDWTFKAKIGFLQQMDLYLVNYQQVFCQYPLAKTTP